MTRTKHYPFTLLLSMDAIDADPRRDACKKASTLSRKALKS